MRVLVTGGLGYLGSHTCIDLLDSGHDVLVIDSLINSSINRLKNITKISDKEVKFERTDIRHISPLIDVFQDFKPEFVIHFAGLKSVSESLNYPIDYYETNVVGTMNVLKAMNACNCKKIIFSSSATVYGNPEYNPCDEEHPTNPINPYGKTKLVAEDLIGDWVVSEDGAKALIYRYFNPVGAHISGLIGESPIGYPNNLMPIILDVATGINETLSIFGDDYPTRDGTGVRDYIHVSDLSMAHAAGVEKLNSLSPYTVINLGTGRNYSIYEVINIFEKATGLKVNNSVAPRRNGDLAEVWASNEKAKNLLKIKFNRSLSEMCVDALRWKQNQIK